MIYLDVALGLITGDIPGCKHYVELQVIYLDVTLGLITGDIPGCNIRVNYR